MSCKEDSNKKVQKQTVVRIEKYGEGHFKNFKNSKNYPKNTQNPIFQDIHNINWRKKSENRLQLELNNIKNDIFENFNNSKLHQK